MENHGPDLVWHLTLNIRAPTVAPRVAVEKSGSGGRSSSPQQNGHRGRPLGLAQSAEVPGGHNYQTSKMPYNSENLPQSHQKIIPPEECWDVINWDANVRFGAGS
jgi:hypothetical protein